MAADATGLNSLRQALTPYDDVKFELNLNRHPKAHTNKSLTHALNMKLSKDTTVIENEESVVENTYIKTVLSSYYTAGYDILHILPCNIELVLFVKGNGYDGFNIWRYREKTNNHNNGLALFYNKTIPYNGGVFSSDFTYTSNDSLIIGFCEYDSTNKEKNPLSTINLGTFTKGYISSTLDWVSQIGEFNDRDLEPYKLPICPEVHIPKITNDYRINNKSYCGNYYFYIRYKINKYDYTQWFSIGYPILNEKRSNKLIHNKALPNVINKDFNDKDLLGAYQSNKTDGGIYMSVNESSDLINNSIVIDINHNNILYDYCQIGYVCIANTYTKYYRSEDIQLKNDITFNTNINLLVEEVFNTTSYSNFYNVKNIINKDNKLYISNYEILNTKVDDQKIKDITLSITHNRIQIDTFNTPRPTTYDVNGATFNVNRLTKTLNKSLYLTLELYNYIKPTSNSIRANRDCVNLVTFLKHLGYEGYVTNHKYYIEIRSPYRAGNAIFTHTYALDELFIGVEKCTSIKSSYSSAYYNDVSLFYLYTDNPSKPINHSQISKTNHNELVSDTDCVMNFDNYPYVNGTYIFGEMEITLLNSGNPSDKIKLNDIIKFNNWDNDYTTHTIIPEKVLNLDNPRPMDNFNRDNILTSLVPGEIYDFYIHFMDKYGDYTDGFRLTNFNEYSFLCNVISNNKSIFYDYACIINVNNTIYVVPNPYRNFVTKDSNDDTIINLDPNETVYVINSFNQNGNYIECYGDIADGINYSVMDIINAFYYILDLDYNLLKDLKLVDIFDCAPINSGTHDVTFLPFFNKDNHSLFRVPYYIYGSDEHDLYIHTLNVHNVENICNYYGFTSYFITYKKLEKVNVLDGIGDINSLTNVLLNTNYDIAPIARVINYEENNQLQYYCSKIGFALYKNCKGFYKANCDILYADSGIDDFKNKQTLLRLSDNVRSESIDYIILNNINKSVYTVSNNILYRLGNINNKSDIRINKGMNGIVKNHTAIFYGSGSEGVVTLQTEKGYTSFGNVSLYDIYNIYDDDHNIPYLTENPKTLNVYNDQNDFKGTDVFFDVITTLNNIGYKSGNINYSNINVYTVYKDDYLKEFNRTIYRSQVISDEGKTNNWRWFENDAYKNVEENKGNITNLIAIGNYLYVHTEHSLFAFSEDNTLSMNNQNLQVATPDIFDTEYKEQFITKLGYGGLQDMDACISGYFGYIWFDRSSKRIYKIYGESMDIVSKDITEWFENVDIIRVDFADDIKNNRVLINIKIKDDTEQTHIVEKDITLSYNTITKTMISFHDYHFSKAYTTKNNLYFLQDIAGSNFDEIHEFDEDNYGFNLGVQKYYSLSFIVNKYYQTLKYLEYIIYKLRKRHIKNATNMHNYIITGGMDFPVEQLLMPYAGDNVRVFNDLADTNLLPCGTMPPSNSVVDYDKPYWDLGNWHFSFLKDHNTNAPGGRLYGNYFIIHFDLGHVTELLEFESFDVTTTEDKKPLM